MLFGATIAFIATAFVTAPPVEAGGLSLAIGAHTNFAQLWAPQGRTDPGVRAKCSGPQDFFLNLKGKNCCISRGTITPKPPPAVRCPTTWNWHGGSNCCVPPKPSSPCDCGEGSKFDQSSMKCVPVNPGRCGPGSWFHERTSTCCPDSWRDKPPRGECPPNTECPPEWFWHKGFGQCRPRHPECPEPQCRPGCTWDSRTRCCRCGPTPSHGGDDGRDHGGKDHGGKDHGGKGGWGHHKRRLSDQTVLSEIDVQNCPKGLNACRVPTLTGQWDYECIDTTTELESCGGCIHDGAGQDCTTIPHIQSVGCESGACQVFSCKAGFRVVNGTSCQAV